MNPLHRLFIEDTGQDLIEYALLGAIVGVGAIAIWQQLVTSVGTAYTGANTSVRTLSSCTPDPASVGGGCP